MTNVFWNQKFSVGNTVLDQQHKKLLMLCQQASRLMADDSFGNNENFHIILNDLATYTREHFKTEEDLLRQNNPALLDRHLAEHISCENQLTDLLIAASNGIFDKERLLRLLKEWWSSHVLQSDLPIKDALK